MNQFNPRHQNPFCPGKFIETKDLFAPEIKHRRRAGLAWWADIITDSTIKKFEFFGSVTTVIAQGDWVDAAGCQVSDFFQNVWTVVHFRLLAQGQKFRIRLQSKKEGQVSWQTIGYTERGCEGSIHGGPVVSSHITHAEQLERGSWYVKAQVRSTAGNLYIKHRLFQLLEHLR